MIYFNIPGIADHYELNIFIMDAKRKYPQFFIPGREISSVFGNFHFCVWDGGRNFDYYSQKTKEDIEQTIAMYNKEFSTPIRYIFTNPTLEEKHLNNRFGNLMLELGHNGLNEVVVNSPLMEKYIRENYPKYKIISSTTKRLAKKEDALKELSNENYYQVCIDYDLNKNMAFLDSIPEKDRGRVEFLVNAICPPGCAFRKQHYYLTGKAHLSYLKDSYSVEGKCGITSNLCRHDVLGKGNNLTNEEIDTYSKNGFKYFKLEGRTIHSSSMLYCYLYYFVKPEYYFDILDMASETSGIFYNDSNSGRVVIKE